MNGLGRTTRLAAFIQVRGGDSTERAHPSTDGACHPVGAMECPWPRNVAPNCPEASQYETLWDSIAFSGVSGHCPMEALDALKTHSLKTDTTVLLLTTTLAFRDLDERAQAIRHIMGVLDLQYTYRVRKNAP